MTERVAEELLALYIALYCTEVVARLLKLLNTLSAEEMEDQLRYI
jgi:hypothetical protein